VADIERSAQEAVSTERRKRNPCVEKGSVSLSCKRGDSAHGWYRVNQGGGLARREALERKAPDQDSTI
jgi:hypothetical protein